MKQLCSILMIITLFSCSKEEQLLNRPIKKDVIAPIISIEQPNTDMRFNDTCTAKLIITDNVAINRVYYYENGFLARSYAVHPNPGRTATQWILEFPFQMHTQQMEIKIICFDLAGNVTQQQKTLKSVF